MKYLIHSIMNKLTNRLEVGIKLQFSVTKSHQVCFQQPHSAAMTVCHFPGKLPRASQEDLAVLSLCMPSRLRYRVIYSPKLRCRYQ